MKQIIVVLNGPPGCGKDTLANALKAKDFATASFKTPIYRMAASLSGVPLNEFISRHTDRELKEQAWDKLAGMSTREFLIHVSERVVKPIYGPDHFGRIAAKNIESLPPYFDVVFSDGGFLPEFDALPHPKLLVRLHAKWASWGNDSRGYIYPYAPNYDLHLVDGKQDMAVNAIMQAVESLREYQA